MRILPRVLAILAGLFGCQSQHRRHRVGYQAVGEALETRNLQGALSSGVTVPGTSHHDGGMSLLGAVEVHHIKVSETKRHVTGGSSRAGVRVVYHPNAAGVPGATATSSPDGSGRINPKDPGGVELVQTADPGKIDPKDPGGVELVRTTASVKLDPKDPGGVELGWVDQAVTERLGPG
jgi:hypothetical protein